MLGDKLGEESGRISGQRVLSVEGGPSVEATFEAAGTLLGVQTNSMATYSSVVRPDGTMYGEGRGVVMTADGEGATYKANGIGRFTGEGMAASYRGSIYWQTASEKLAKLNGTVGLFEYEVDAEGNTHAAIWEWK